jgi:hypothetical protein
MRLLQRFGIGKHVVERPARVLVRPSPTGAKNRDKDRAKEGWRRPFVSLFDLGERALGLFRLATGVWLMYLTWAATLNLALGYIWPL